ncbi:hypothetical protein ABZ707_20540 [Streptomyces sp. NPDC006923]|uniref:hypothetical protein n=1 Tax=Streptomyces sp. NPDC006923 TaxID=3155355 RepID=UPI0033FFB1B1
MPSWAWLTVLTAGALAIVGAVALGADRAAPHRAQAGAGRPSASPSAKASPSPRPESVIPAGSGEGRRIVYSLRQRRVWLVDVSDKPVGSFTVWPGTVSPVKGSYGVTFRKADGTGSDGVQIENVVYFAVESGISIAFSNAVDGASPEPAAGLQTGGIRVRSADGGALWKFGTVGTKVAVVD